MATKIKLMRIGKMREPHYRIVVADARTKRDGRSIEAVGEYHPKDEPSTIKVNSDRVQYWLGVGAQPTESVAAILPPGVRAVTFDQRGVGGSTCAGDYRVEDYVADIDAVRATWRSP